MNGHRVGYLPQSPVFKKGEVVMDYMIRICKITNADEESKAKTVLTKIGINDFYADVDTLSGGQKKRVAIGAAMISPVDLLILDEPTNHIDSETIAWMENNLKSTTKALLMVTHDRYFLDRVVNKTFELDKGQNICLSGKLWRIFWSKRLREKNLPIQVLQEKILTLSLSCLCKFFSLSLLLQKFSIVSLINIYFAFIKFKGFIYNSVKEVSIVSYH